MAKPSTQTLTHANSAYSKPADKQEEDAVDMDGTLLNNLAGPYLLSPIRLYERCQYTFVWYNKAGFVFKPHKEVPLTDVCYFCNTKVTVTYIKGPYGSWQSLSHPGLLHAKAASKIHCLPVLEDGLEVTNANEGGLRNNSHMMSTFRGLGVAQTRYMRGKFACSTVHQHQSVLCLGYNCCVPVGQSHDHTIYFLSWSLRNGNKTKVTPCCKDTTYQ